MSRMKRDEPSDDRPTGQGQHLTLNTSPEICSCVLKSWNFPCVDPCVTIVSYTRLGGLLLVVRRPPSPMALAGLNYPLSIYHLCLQDLAKHVRLPIRDPGKGLPLPTVSRLQPETLRCMAQKLQTQSQQNLIQSYNITYSCTFMVAVFVYILSTMPACLGKGCVVCQALRKIKVSQHVVG